MSENMSEDGDHSHSPNQTNGGSRPTDSDFVSSVYASVYHARGSSSVQRSTKPAVKKPFSPTVRSGSSPLVAGKTSQSQLLARISRHSPSPSNTLPIPVDSIPRVLQQLTQEEQVVMESRKEHQIHVAALLDSLHEWQGSMRSEVNLQTTAALQEALSPLRRLLLHQGIACSSEMSQPRSRVWALRIASEMMDLRLALRRKSVAGKRSAGRLRVPEFAVYSISVRVGAASIAGQRCWELYQALQRYRHLDLTCDMMLLFLDEVYDDADFDFCVALRAELMDDIEDPHDLTSIMIPAERWMATATTFFEHSTALQLVEYLRLQATSADIHISSSVSAMTFIITALSIKRTLASKPPIVPPGIHYSENWIWDHMPDSELAEAAFACLLDECVHDIVDDHLRDLIHEERLQELVYIATVESEQRAQLMQEQLVSELEEVDRKDESLFKNESRLLEEKERRLEVDKQLSTTQTQLALALHEVAKIDGLLCMLESEKEQVIELRGAIAYATPEVTRCHSLIDTLKSKCESLTSELSSTSTKLSETDRRLRETSSQLEMYQSQESGNAEARSEVQLLREKTSSLTKEVLELRDIAESARSTMSRQTVELSQQEAQVASLSANLRKALAENESLKARNAQLEHSEEDNRISSVRDLKELKQQLDEKTRQADQLQEMLQRTQAADTVDAELDHERALQEHILQLQTQLESIESQYEVKLSQKDFTISDLESNIDDLHTQLGAMTEEISDLRAQLESKAADEERLTEIEHLFKQEQQAAAIAKKTIEADKKSIITLREQVGHLQSMFSQAQTEAAKERDQRVQLQQQVLQLQMQRRSSTLPSRGSRVSFSDSGDENSTFASPEPLYKEADTLSRPSNLESPTSPMSVAADDSAALLASASVGNIGEVMAVEMGSHPSEPQDLYFCLFLSLTGKQLYKSETVKKSRNPKWGAMPALKSNDLKASKDFVIRVYAAKRFGSDKLICEQSINMSNLSRYNPFEAESAQNMIVFMIKEKLFYLPSSGSSSALGNSADMSQQSILSTDSPVHHPPAVHFAPSVMLELPDAVSVSSSRTSLDGRPSFDGSPAILPLHAPVGHVETMTSSEPVTAPVVAPVTLDISPPTPTTEAPATKTSSELLTPVVETLTPVVEVATTETAKPVESSPPSSVVETKSDPALVKAEEPSPSLSEPALRKLSSVSAVSEEDLVVSAGRARSQTEQPRLLNPLFRKKSIQKL